MPSGPCISWWSVGCTRCMASSFHSFPSLFAFRYQSMPFVCLLSFLNNILFQCCESRISDVYPGSWIRIFPSRIPDPGSKRLRIPDPDTHQRISVFLTQKNVSELSEYYPGCSVHPRSGSWFFSHPYSVSSGQKGTGSRITDPESGSVTLFFYLVYQYRYIITRIWFLSAMPCDASTYIICRPF